MSPRFPRVALAAALTTACLTAEASVISVQTRASTSQYLGSAAASQTTVEGLMGSLPGSGYCNSSPGAWSGLSNQSSCGGVAGDIAFDISAQFGVSGTLGGTWSFRIGPDFGRGGALFIDGVGVSFIDDDLWWSGNFANSGELLVATVSLSTGNHTIEAYGFEGCCDGLQEAQFLAPGSTVWTVFSNNDGLDRISQVPEPGTLLLAGAALVGLTTRRRRT